MKQKSNYTVRVNVGDTYRILGKGLDESERDYYIKLYRATFPNLEVVEEEGGNKTEGDSK